VQAAFRLAVLGSRRIMAAEVERLHVYQHCPRCGGSRVSVKPPQAIDCADCGLCLYVNPAAAVAVILLDRADCVLLTRRANEPAKGKLGFPGGFVDLGESGEQALCREIVEEVGLEVRELQFLCSYPNRYAFAGVIYPTLDLFFVARVDSFDAARPLDGVASLERVPAAALDADELAFDSLKRAWQAFRGRSGR
jgi:ADP-ribose pyrophosphatase YjhB (NUDIX family)